MTEADNRAAPISTGGMRNETAPTPDLFPPPEAMRPTLIGERWMVSAGHPLVAQIAGDVLRAGGSAIDAGVAAGFASNVVQADMCNLGGVAPIVLRRAGEAQVWAISGVGWWGRAATLEAFVERYGQDMPLGAGVGVVPAAADAWISALKRFGTWRLADVLQPAIELAAHGWLLDHRTAQSLEILGRGFRQWPSSRHVYWPQDRPPSAGERLVQADLARTLGLLAEADRDARTRSDGLAAARRRFYEGEIAERIVRWCRENGGWLDRDDLRDFRCTITPAPSYAHGHWRLFTTDTYSQGPVMLQALSVLAGFDLQDFDPQSADYLHLVAEALKLGFSDRDLHYADPAFAERPLEALFEPDHITRLRSMIDLDRALPDLPTHGAAKPGRKRFDTTYLAVVDQEGNAFSAMPSDTLDGAPLVDGLGILVSPRGVQSRLDPSHPAVLGPRRRPRLTPAPAIALADGDEGPARVMAFGSPGGDVIVQAMLQAFLNLTVFGQTGQEAVEAPRIATFSYPDSFFPNPHFPGRLSVEGRIPDQVRARLADKGHAIHVWPDWEFDAGGVAMAGHLVNPPSGSRPLFGAADPRRSAYAIGR